MAQPPPDTPSRPPPAAVADTASPPAAGPEAPSQARRGPPVADAAPPEPRDRMTTVLLCVLLGPMGVHRFYTGHHGIGAAQLFTMGGCGAWWVADLLALYRGTYTDADGAPLAG